MIRYQATGKVHGILQPEGLQQSQEFPNGPIYTREFLLAIPTYVHFLPDL